MIRAVTYLKRRPGMPMEEFRAYWRDAHPKVVTRLPGLRRYVQSHARRAEYVEHEPAYDGIAEVWFDDSKALRALRDTPEMAAVQADEAHFLDRDSMGLILTDDHVVKDGPTRPLMAKGIGFLKRKPGTPVEAFQKHWREVHGPLGARVPQLRRYEQCHTRLAAYAGGREPTWDGVALVWFDDDQAMREAVLTPEYARMKADDGNLVGPGPIPFIVTTEHVIFG